MTMSDEVYSRSSPHNAPGIGHFWYANMRHHSEEPHLTIFLLRSATMSLTAVDQKPCGQSKLGFSSPARFPNLAKLWFPHAPATAVCFMLSISPSLRWQCFQAWPLNRNSCFLHLIARVASEKSQCLLLGFGLSNLLCKQHAQWLDVQLVEDAADRWRLSTSVRSQGC